MFVADGGYLGVISQRDRMLHCGALVAADAPMPTKPLEAIGWFVDRSPLLSDAFGPGWRSRAERIVASGPMPWRTTARTTSTVALLGDAAGYIEPFTGEGMRWAMASAWELANAIGLGGGHPRPAIGTKRRGARPSARCTPAVRWSHVWLRRRGFFPASAPHGAGCRRWCAR
jgi:2-polyprenyl-6-methoxyphenol hydroxylase-like FAD-dependent oxidoreductase